MTSDTSNDGGLYLALGDSLAVGVGSSRPSETGYVARLPSGRWVLRL